MSFRAPLIETILSQMPLHAEKYITEAGGGNFALSIYWKLNNDPQRPNKYSRTIAIIIARELLEDFDGYPSDVQESSLSKVRSFISSKLKQFDPDHNHPRWAPEPIEKWTLSIDDLFSPPLAS